MNIQTVYAVIILTPQKDLLLGAIYDNREAADAEAKRIERAFPGGTQQAWVEPRQMEKTHE